MKKQFLLFFFLLQTKYSPLLPAINKIEKEPRILIFNQAGYKHFHTGATTHIRMLFEQLLSSGLNVSMLANDLLRTNNVFEKKYPICSSITLLVVIKKIWLVNSI